MKNRKTNFWIFSLAFIGAMVLAFGCNDDDDDDENDNNDEYGNPHYGSWIGFYDETFEGWDEKDCNTVFYSFETADFLMCSFLDSDPAAGLKGLYSLNDDNEMVIYPDHSWSDEIYDWNEDNRDERILPLEFSSDEQTMTVTTSFGDIDVKKCNPSDPEALEGEWLMIDEDTIASMSIEASGAFMWEQDDGSQSGMISDLGEIDGNKYLLIHITYCEFEADGDSNYYVIERYAINEAGDELTMWHGNDEYSLTLYEEDE